jgi:hypothetical protein
MIISRNDLSSAYQGRKQGDQRQGDEAGLVQHGDLKKKAGIWHEIRDGVRRVVSREVFSEPSTTAGRERWGIKIYSGNRDDEAIL